MNALVLLLFAALIALFGGLQYTDSGTDDGDIVGQPDDEVEQGDGDDEEGNGDDENGDNGNGDEENPFAFNISDQQTLDLIYADHGESIASFPQDLVTLEMTQDDVIAEYGEPEEELSILRYTVHQYGDIGVAYFAEDDTVADVLYMPSISYDELVAVLGAPDEEVFEFDEAAQDDTPYVNYVIQENEDSNLNASFKLQENENGEFQVWFMDKVAVAEDNDDSGAGDITAEEMDEISNTLSGYYQVLGAYYRGENEDIFNYLYGEENELTSLIIANNESGEFTNYEVLSWAILTVARVGEDENAYEVVVEREFTFGDESQFEEVTMIVERTDNGLVVASSN